MPNRQELPHLLHVTLGEDGVEFKVECQQVLSKDMPCASHVECREHPINRPLTPEPKFTWLMGKRFYEDVDFEAIAEWEAYWQKSVEWDEGHPLGAYHPTAECWVVQFVAEGTIGDSWDISGFPNGTPIVSPLQVQWHNEGSVDDGYLMLSPWVAQS